MTLFLLSELGSQKEQQMAMKIEFLLILLTFSSTKFSVAFTPHHKNHDAICRSMVGGRGWDNDDYLSGLSGDEEDRKKIEDDYQDFHQRRSAFQKRQQEYLEKSPQAREFLKQQQAQSMGNRDDMDDDMDPFDEFSNLQAGSGGGTRMAQMMAQSKRMQQPKPSNQMFQQKLAVPLDEDFDTSSKEEEDDDIED